MNKYNIINNHKKKLKKQKKITKSITDLIGIESAISTNDSNHAAAVTIS